MSKWISVKDRLPETNNPSCPGWSDMVLVFVKCTDRRTKPPTYKWSHITTSQISGIHNDWISSVREYITHWMPLPEPPDDN